MSDSNAKPPGKKGGKGGSGSGSRGDVGNLLKSTYNDTLREDIPPDLLALLGKLD